jgi:hypothetical protein
MGTMDTLYGPNGADDDNSYEYDAIDAPLLVSRNERRLHALAYEHWSSLLGDRTLPSIADLDPAALASFSDNSVLFDFTLGTENPAIIYVGSSLRQECGIDTVIERADQLPAGSLLTCLAPHHDEAIKNAAPVSFEAKFTNQRNAHILYRGILLPFSSNGSTIDFIYGVMSWKELACDALSRGLNAEIENALRISSVPADIAEMWAEGLDQSEEIGSDDFDLAEANADSAEDIFDLAGYDCPTECDETASESGLISLLDSARESAESAQDCNARSRIALYAAIGRAYDVALAARKAPEDYAALLEINAIAVPERSPNTAVIKLVFGADYDKTRIAEYATALDYAFAQDLPAGTLAPCIEQHEGGLKGLVHAVRASKSSGETHGNQRLARASAKLLKAKPISISDIAWDENGLGIAILRRSEDGNLTIIKSMDTHTKAAQSLIVLAAKRKRAS